NGRRTSVAPATGAGLVATGAEALAAIAAGCLGGWLDDLLMRAADVQLAFPVIMLAIAIVSVVGTSPLALVGVLSLSGWVLQARTVRAHVLSVRRLEYIDAAGALGASQG